METVGSKVKIISLHGFLGLPSDWDLLKSYFMISSLAQQFDWWSVDYMKTPGLTPQNDFASWARNLNLKIRQKFPEGPRVLIGYSLGGRLALQALKAAPEMYDKLIFISTNPGLQRDKEKEDRAQNDLQWSQKFLEAPWENTLQEWNSQAVFKSSTSEPLRQEGNYNRRDLAQSLLEWSLAQQEDFRDLISQNSEKILWISGEKDLKFASMAMDLKRRAPALKTEIFPRASHRVMFDQPHELAKAVIQFLE